MFISRISRISRNSRNSRNKPLSQSINEKWSWLSGLFLLFPEFLLIQNLNFKFTDLREQFDVYVHFQLNHKIK